MFLKNVEIIYVKQAEIEKLLEEVCAILPPSIKSQCDAIVTDYGPLIIQFLLQKLSPQQVCAVLKLCTNGKIYITRQLFELYSTSQKKQRFHCSNGDTLNSISINLVNLFYKLKETWLENFNMAFKISIHMIL